MKAVVVERPGVIVLKDVPEPSIGRNEILIKVLSASICNSTDYHIFEGTFLQHHDYYPQILGHEVCGEVLEIGPQVENIEIGERLAFYTRNGAFCEYTKVDADWAWARIPDEISDEEGSLCEMFHGAHIQSVYPSKQKDNENVIIIGVGPMGLVTLQCVKAMSNVKIGAIDLVDFRLNKANEVGADFIFNRAQISQDRLAQQINESMGQIDLVHICTDLDQSKEQDLFDFAVNILKPFGRLTGLNVEIKGLTHKVRILPLFAKNIELARSLDLDAYSRDFKETGAGHRKAIQMGVDWVVQGKINLKTLITHRLMLDEVMKGLDLCHSRLNETIKVVVKIS